MRLLRLSCPFECNSVWRSMIPNVLKETNQAHAIALLFTELRFDPRL